MTTSTAASTGTAPGRVRMVGDGPLARRLAEGLRAAGAEVVGEGGPDATLDAVVFAPWDPAEVTPVPLAELDDEGFGRAWQDTMDAAIATCVAARDDFAGRGGRIVLTAPSTAFVGGARYGHWAAAAEGVHVLAKSVARQWGPEGIAVNVLAVGPDGVLAEPAVAGPVSIATPAVPDADPGPVLALLCSPAAANLAGQTVTVDGGLWM